MKRLLEGKAEDERAGSDTLIRLIGCVRLNESLVTYGVITAKVIGTHNARKSNRHTSPRRRKLIGQFLFEAFTKPGRLKSHALPLLDTRRKAGSGPHAGARHVQAVAKYVGEWTS